ncbi:MAG: penicillin-binding protein, partial [Bacteroidia bacterium]|nr:penicillin-binding protein [Bacteroidia bacterium]
MLFFENRLTFSFLTETIIVQSENVKYKTPIRIFWILIILSILFVVGLLSATAFGVFGKLPTFEELERPESNLASEVYTSDNVLLGKYYKENRSNVRYEDLSPNLVNALIATEDIRFDEHPGIDLRGLARVFVKTVILQQDAGGGSTITQQLSKNLFHDRPQSLIERIKQKLKEWIISIRLEKNYTKKEIIAMYFNEVEFGHNSYGIRSASNTFFSCSESELNIQQAAVLVGLLKAPTYYSPVNNRENRSLIRRNTVIGQMEKYEFITTEEADSLKLLPLELKYKAQSHTEGLATYFREVLRQELNTWCKENFKGNEPYNLYTDGLRIYTTLDSRMQKYAEEAAREHLESLQKTFFKHWKNQNAFKEQPQIIESAIKNSQRYKSLKNAGKSRKEIDEIFNTKDTITVFTYDGEKDTLITPLDSIKYYKKFLHPGFMSMDPKTGHVKAWVGGANYKHFQYDHVRYGKRQVGSTFKPFLYTLAMQEGFSPCYKLPNVPITIPDPHTGEDWTPKNSDGKYGGMLSLKEALANSVNVISANLIKQFRPQPVVDLTKKLGLTSEIPPYHSIALGTPDVSVYEMVGAYSTFANKGVRTEPIFITRIEDKNGIVLYEKIPKKMEVISEETAYLMLELLKGVVDHGTGVRLKLKYGFTQAIAGKTGTTQNHSDGWFMGITPELVSGVWVGCEDRSVHFRSISLGQGANMALPIWALYMKNVYADKDLNISQEDFRAPARELGVELDCSKYENQNAGTSEGE